jgi:hypothetical protein
MPTGVLHCFCSLLDILLRHPRLEPAAMRTRDCEGSWSLLTASRRGRNVCPNPYLVNNPRTTTNDPRDHTVEEFRWHTDRRFVQRLQHPCRRALANSIPRRWRLCRADSRHWQVESGCQFSRVPHAIHSGRRSRRQFSCHRAASECFPRWPISNYPKLAGQLASIGFACWPWLSGNRANQRVCHTQGGQSYSNR